MYSQRNEEQYINEYFGSYIGTLLDIEANDGKTLSNSLACIERGWSGTLVEPSKSTFDKLFALHAGRRDRVECVNVAICEEDGIMDFYESGSHLNQGDHSLLSSLRKDETVKWESSTEFTKTTVTGMRFDQLLALSTIKKFDLISIDAEGVDYDILTQIDLEEVGCRMLIVEFNQLEPQKYITYAAQYGMRLYKTLIENLIFAR